MTEAHTLTAIAVADEVVRDIPARWRWGARRQVACRVVTIARQTLRPEVMELAASQVHPRDRVLVRRAVINDVRREYASQYFLDPWTWLMIGRIVIALIRWWMSRASRQQTWERFCASG